MQTPSVCVIILQYNNSQDTIRCLNSVKELDYPNHDTVVVDNNSNVKHIDEIGNWIEKEKGFNLHTKYKLLNTKYNIGYSGGNNIGIRYALEHGADYVFILNPDTTVGKDTLAKLVETAQSDPKIGILGPSIDEGGRITYGGKIEWLKPELRHITQHETQNMEQKKYIPGAAMLIKKEVMEQIGLLDETYFLYFEDADFCQRAKRAGYKLAIVQKALIRHQPSSSTLLLGTPLLLRYHYRNAHLFNRKNGPLWVKFVLPFWSIFIMIKQVLKILFIPAKREISKAVFIGVVDFYRGRFGKINAQDRN